MGNLKGSTGLLGPASAVSGVNGKAITPLSVSTGSLTSSALTSGRIPYATTAGLLTDAAGLTFNGTTLVVPNLTNSSLTATRIPVAGTAGLMQDYAGLCVVGTPSATAPSAGTNGPGTLTGVINQSANGSSSFFTPVTFGNGSSRTSGVIGYACQGTAASPGATVNNDAVALYLRGHDGTNYTATSCGFLLSAGSTWTPSNSESYVMVQTCANGATATTNAARFDSTQSLTVGGNGSASVGMLAGGTTRARVQVFDNTPAKAGVASISWNAGSAGPVNYLAKSHSTTIGTPGVITTGDVLGTMSFQGDDGTNFIESARIRVTSTGTIATNQVPGSMTFDVANSSGTVATRLTMTATAAIFASGTPVTHSDTTDATSKTTGANITSGGTSVAKNLIVGQNIADGVAITATAAATTTLTSASTGVQIFTGSTTQNVQLPAANLFGAGISVQYTIVNRSSGTVTALRAGSDTINAAATSFAVATVTTSIFYSDGVSAWYTK